MLTTIMHTTPTVMTMLTTDSWHHDDGHDHDDDDDDDGDDNDDDGGDADEHDDDDDDAHDEFSVLSREWLCIKLCIHAAKAHYQNAKLYSTVAHTKLRLGHGPVVDMAMGRLLTC